MARYTRKFLETRLGNQLKEAGFNFVITPWKRKADDSGADAIIGAVFLEGQRSRWTLSQMSNAGGGQKTLFDGHVDGLIAFGDGIECAMRHLNAIMIAKRDDSLVRVIAGA